MRLSRLLSYLLPCTAATATLALSHEAGHLHVRADTEEDAVLIRPTSTDIFYHEQPYAVQWTPPKSKVPVWVSLVAYWTDTKAEFYDTDSVTISNIEGDTAVINNGTFWWIPNKKSTFQGRWYLILYTVSDGSDCSKVACSKFEYNMNSTYLATGEPFMIANAVPAVETTISSATSKSTPVQTILPVETVASGGETLWSESETSSVNWASVGVVIGLVALLLMGAGIVGWRRCWLRPRDQDSFVKEKCEMDGGFNGTRPTELPARRWHAHELGGGRPSRKESWAQELEGGRPSRKEWPPVELPGSEPGNLSRDSAVVQKP